MARKRGPRLQTLQDVSAYLAQLIRDVHRDELPLAKARSLTFMLNTLKGCLEASDIERRVEELEKQIASPPRKEKEER
jgi:hypothetical protein